MNFGDDDKIKRKLDVKLFMEHLKLKFNRILDSMTANKTKPKDLVIIESIRPIFELIIEKESLIERNVNLVWLNPTTIQQYDDEDVEVMVFFVPPRPKLVSKIGSFLKILRSKGMVKQNHIVFYPKRTILCKYVMETEGMMQHFKNKVYDFNFDLIPLSHDLLSLEYKLSVGELLKTAEFTIHNLAAESLQRLQLVFGKIPTFIGKGKNARVVLDILSRLEKEHAARLQYDKDLAEIDGCIILDREIDLLTPLCTQMTYHGALDELFKIDCNLAKVEREILSMEEEVKEGKMNFYFSDEVFDGIKDQNMTVIGKFLQLRLMEYQELVKDKSAFEDLKKAKEITKEVKKKKLLEPHVNIAFHVDTELRLPLKTDSIRLEAECLMGQHSNDEITKYIEGLILGGHPLLDIYRLICTQSIVEGGLRPKTYSQYRKEILENYGIGQLITLQELKKHRMLFPGLGNIKKSQFAKLKKIYNLIDMNYDQRDLMKGCYPYNGYNPLTIRLVEAALRDGWTSLGEKLKLVPGPSFLKGDPRNLISSQSRKKVILVYGVGGFTYAETAGIRALGKKYNVEIVMAVTNMIDYSRLLKPLIHK